MELVQFLKEIWVNKFIRTNVTKMTHVIPHADLNQKCWIQKLYNHFVFIYEHTVFFG